MPLINLYLVDNDKVNIHGFEPYDEHIFAHVPRVGEQISITIDEKDITYIYNVVAIVYPIEYGGNTANIYVKEIGLLPDFENYLIEEYVDDYPAPE